MDHEELLEREFKDWTSALAEIDKLRNLIAELLPAAEWIIEFNNSFNTLEHINANTELRELVKEAKDAISKGQAQ